MSSHLHLFPSLASSESSVATLVSDWLDLYNDESSFDESRTDLVNLLIGGGGTKLYATISDLVDHDTAENEQFLNDCVATVSETEQGPLKKNKKFPKRYHDFWRVLSIEISKQKRWKGSLGQFIFHWITLVSNASIGSFRHAALMALFGSMSGIQSVAIDAKRRLEVARTQLEDISSMRSKAKKSQQTALERDVKEYSTESSLLEDAMKLYFTRVIAHRYRDSIASIRELCYDELGKWMLEYPSLWLSADYLKYLGWMLSDQEAAGRAAALTSIYRLYEKAEKEDIDKMRQFKDRFIQRFNAMASDKDPNVASIAIRLFIQLLKLGELDHSNENNGEKIPSMAWDENPKTSAAACDFIFEDIFTNEEKEDREADLTQLVSVVMKYAPLENKNVRSNNNDNPAITLSRQFSHQTALFVLVDQFWDRLDALRDWKTLLKLVQPDGKKMGKAAQDRLVLYCHLLCACVKRAAIPIKNAEEKTVSKEDNAIYKSMNDALIPALADLLTRYQTDEAILLIILPIIRFIDVNAFSKARKRADFTSIVNAIQSIYFKQSVMPVLQECIASFRYLSISHQYAEDASGAISEIADKLCQTFQSAASDDTKLTNEDERYVTLLNDARRILAIIRCVPVKEIDWIAYPIFGETMTQLIEALEGDYNRMQELLLVALVQILHYVVLWRFRSTVPSPNEEQNKPKIDEGAVKELSELSQFQMKSVLTIMQNGKSYDCSDEAFRSLVDIFTLFGGRISRTQIDSLQRLAIPEDLLTPLDLSFRRYLYELLRADGEIDKRFQGDDESQLIKAREKLRMEAISATIKTCLFDFEYRGESIILHHMELASYLVLHYRRVEESSCNEAIREFMVALKNQCGTEVLLQVQIGALKLLYGYQVGSEQLTALADNLVHVHNVKPDSRSFTHFIIEGIKFAFSEQGERLSFLQSLHPFVSRASNKDLEQVDEYWRAHSGPMLDQLGEDENDEITKFGEDLSSRLEKKRSKKGAAASKGSPGNESLNLSRISSPNVNNSLLASPGFLKSPTPPSASSSARKSFAKRRLTTTREEDEQEENQMNGRSEGGEEEEELSTKRGRRSTRGRGRGRGRGAKQIRGEDDNAEDDEEETKPKSRRRSKKSSEEEEDAMDVEAEKLPTRQMPSRRGRPSRGTLSVLSDEEQDADEGAELSD